MFQLTKAEFESLRFHFETSNPTRGGTRYNPYAFTEQGVAMLSSVLNSDIAIDVNISIIRIFVILRQFALGNKELTLQIQALEAKYDQKFNNVAQALDYLLQKDQKQTDQQNRKKIGYK